MADKTPVRVVFNASNVATGMAEFQTGESVPVTNGGTGLTAVGSAGQIIKVNAAGTALEFGAEGDLSITNLVAPTNADLTLTTSGTGNIILDAITVRGTTISSADSSTININDNVEIDGNLVVTGTVDFNDQNISNVGSLSIDSISGDADTNTSITFSGSDVITVATGGSTAATFNADQTTTFSGAVAGTSADFDGGVTIDNITIDGTEIDLSSGDLTIDVAGDILLDAGGNDVKIVNGGTELARFTNNSQNLIIKNPNQDKDITFSGNDGGSNVDALILDMSEAGTATFSHDVILPNNGILQFGDAGENIAGDGTNLTITSSGTTTVDSTGDIILDGSNTTAFKAAGTEYFKIINNSGSALLRNTGQDNDISFVGNDGGSTITALTLDMSEAGAATFNSTVTLGTNKAIQFVDANESVSSDGTNLILTSGGTTFKMPIADGTSGQALITDGSGTLSFDTVTTTLSDDTRAVVKNNKKVNTSAKTVDYFQDTAFDMAWYFMALNDLTNDHTSGSVFTVCHNNTTAFIGSARGGCSGTGNLLPTTSADIAADQVRVKITGPSADGKVSFYKIPISTANTADATSGNTVTTSNVDVDSASESVDTFAHASFRAAKYTILIDDDAKTETGVTEALVVHDGTNAFVAQFGTVNTGNNNMITLSAAISGSNVVLSAAGLTANLKLKIHKILLSDSMTAIANGNQKVIGATTVSSTATAFDSFDLDDTTAAVYYVVGKNDTESAYSIQEVYMAGDIGEAGISSGPFVSTKGTTQLEFTGAYIGTADNTVQMTVSATSGASTVVNAYRISCLAEE